MEQRNTAVVENLPKRSKAAPVGVALVSLVGVSAAGMLFTHIPRDEGVVLRGYLDPVGIPTKCMGDTSDVIVGKRYSMEACRAGMERQLVAHAVPVLKCSPSLRYADYRVRYATISYAYNVGAARFCRKVAPFFNRGETAAGCRAMAKPTTARGVELRGLVLRRQREVAICLQGAA